MTVVAIPFFCGAVAKKKKKKMTIVSSPSSMTLLQKKVMIIGVTFFSGFTVKKLTATMSSPFAMVLVLVL
jgi:hypothetical protein